MVIEVIKLRDVEIEPGKKATIIEIEDFKRLISSYNLTLDIFKHKLGLTRSLWDNTLKYHNLHRDDILAWRNNVLVHDRLHLNSNHGFSKTISKDDLVLAAKETNTSKFLKALEVIEPNINNIWLSKINKDPMSLSKDLVSIGRKIVELQQISKRLHNRVRKNCIKKGVEHSRRIVSTLENTVANILDELGYIYEAQFFLKPHHYDFLIGGKIILEIDGGGHDDRFDDIKNIKAKSNGYTLIRVNVGKSGINKGNYDNFKNQIHKKIRQTNCI